MKTTLKPKNNLGGLLKIWAVPQSVISVNKKTVTITSLENVYEILFTVDSLFLKQEPKKTASGIHFDTVVSCFVPGNTEHNLDAIAEMENKPFELILADGNESYLHIGERNYPLRLNGSLTQGKTIGDLAGFEISFSGNTISRAAFIDNPF
jgi:hypothetical protein